MVALDSRAEVLAAAAHANPAVATTPGLTLQVGDGRSLPYPDRSFDIVHSSLVLHHLSEADARAFLAEMARVARLGIVVNDLSRSRLGWIGAWLMAPPAHAQPVHPPRRAALGPARLPAAEVWALLRGAGLVPVQTRYAAPSASATRSPRRAPGSADDIGAPAGCR